MLVAIYHPLAQIWTLRTGQAAYHEHVVNFEQRTHKFFANLPPPPSDLPILLIRRKTRDGWSKERRRAPFVVNRHRLEAAFKRLLTSHREYNGQGGNPRPDISNLDRFYSDCDENGDVQLAVNEFGAPAERGVAVDRRLFAKW